MNTHKKIRKLCHCSVSALETVIDCVSKEKQIAVWIHRGSCFLFPLYLNIFIWDKTNLALKNMKGFCIEKREGRLFLEERTFLHKGERILKEWLKVSVTAPPPTSTRIRKSVCGPVIMKKVIQDQMVEASFICCPSWDYLKIEKFTFPLG